MKYLKLFEEHNNDWSDDELNNMAEMVKSGDESTIIMVHNWLGDLPFAEFVENIVGIPLRKLWSALRLKGNNFAEMLVNFFNMEKMVFNAQVAVQFEFQHEIWNILHPIHHKRKTSKISYCLIAGITTQNIRPAC